MLVTNTKLHVYIDTSMSLHQLYEHLVEEHY